MGVDKPVKGDKKRQKKAPSKSQSRKSQPPAKESLGSSKSVGAPHDELPVGIKTLGETKASEAGGAEAKNIVESNVRGDADVKQKMVKTKLNVPASALWYNHHYSLPPPSVLVDSSTVASLRSHAADLHSSLPLPKTTSASDQQFVSNILTSGTLSDKLSALTLLAQSSPIHNVRALESLKAMAAKKAREESLKALRAIIDWWVGGGAPDRKLKYFADQPLTHPDVTDGHLTYWYFEDWLKKYFFSILQILETLSMDLLPYVRTQAMNLIFQLLDTKPEQEQNLLRVLVNKLGDVEKTVASKASYYVLQLLQHHPGMKHIVIREVSDLIFRPATSSGPASTSKPDAASHIKFGGSNNPSFTPIPKNHHARYYGVITLNQVTLSRRDLPLVSGSLIDLYFKLFEEILNESGTKAENPPTEDKKDEKGQGGRGGKKSKQKQQSTQALDGFMEAEDVHSKIISAILTGVNRALPFAKLIEGTLLDHHIDTLFRITHTATFNVSIQALVLIQQVTASKNTAIDRFYRSLYESIIDSRLVCSSKQAMWLNLAFKSMKADDNQARLAAFVKRLLQSLTLHQPAFICGTLYMLDQLINAAPGLRAMTEQSRPNAAPEETSKRKRKRRQEIEANPGVIEKPYDPRKREPQFANAETACLWELVPLVYHFHPSVSLHAKQILSSLPVTTTADLALNTLSHFLDRFVYKNPKKPKPRGASAMQPAAAAAMDPDAAIVRNIRGGMSGLTITEGAGVLGSKGTVNEAAFWNKKATEIPVNELFFHRFFMNKLDREKEKAKKIAKRKKNQHEDGDAGDLPDGDNDVEVPAVADSDEAADSDSDSSDEAEVWKAMKQTMPGPHADLDLMEDDDDTDSIPNGLDDLDDEDEDVPGSQIDPNGESSDVEDEAGSEEASDPDEMEHVEEDEGGSEEGNLVESDVDLLALSDVEFLDTEGDETGMGRESSPSAFEPEDSETVSGTRRPHPEDTRKGGRKRRKVGTLPTFASYEDYAKLIEEGPEDDI